MIFKICPIFLILTVAILSGIILASEVEEYQANIIRNYQETKRIEKLYLPKLIILKNIEYGVELKTVATFAARFERKGWNLFIGDSWTYKADQKSMTFSFDIPIENIITSFKIHAIGPGGEIEVEHILVEVPKWKELLSSERQDFNKRSYLVTTLGYTTLVYREDNHPTSDKTFVNLKLEYQLPFWNLAISSRYGFMPIDATNTSEGTTFIDVDLRSGYTLPFLGFPWKMGVGAGVYYSNIMENKVTVGYKDMLGVELNYSLQRMFRNGDLFTLFLKYSRDKQGIDLAWYKQLKINHPFIFKIDYEKIKTEYNSINISSKAFYLNIGYGW